MSKVKQYRKKPVVIEAMPLIAYTQGFGPEPWNDHKPSELYTWMTANGAKFYMDQQDPGPAYMIIETLEGPIKASIGDYIIKGISGEFYPCKPDIFAKTYEEVNQ